MSDAQLGTQALLACYALHLWALVRSEKLMHYCRQQHDKDDHISMVISCDTTRLSSQRWLAECNGWSAAQLICVHAHHEGLYLPALEVLCKFCAGFDGCLEPSSWTAGCVCLSPQLCLLRVCRGEQGDLLSCHRCLTHWLSQHPPWIQGRWSALVICPCPLEE